MGRKSKNFQQDLQWFELNAQWIYHRIKFDKKVHSHVLKYKS